MNKKICITSIKSVGCTFVDWSVYFLSGQNNFYKVNTQSWEPLSTNPVTGINSHGHFKNHPSGLDIHTQYFNLFDTLPSDRFYTSYSMPMHVDTAAAMLNISINDVGKEYKKIKEYINNNYNKLLKSCNDQNIKLVFVSSDPRTPFYSINVRSLDRHMLKPKRASSVNEILEEAQNTFFKDSINTWNHLGLSNIWDIRERQALDMKIHTDNEEFIDALSFPHLWINCLDLWTRGETVLKNIMEYLEIDVDQRRLDQWKPIYKHWQTILLNNLEFDYNCDHIIDAIVNNWYYKINLTFQQEVIVQHLLIYKHNLNIKTWQLEKFPSNTQDLHKLLEPNIHDLTQSRCA